MKNLYYILFVCLSCGFGFAEDESFLVSAKLEQGTETSAVLSVSFSVPKNHLLYADMIRITSGTSGAEKGIKITPKKVPLPEKKFDPLNDSEREVYKKDFQAEYFLTGKINYPIKINVGYQGCDDSVCFLPESKEFLLEKSSEDGRRRTEDGGRKTEDGRRKTEDGGRKTEDGGRKTEDGGRKTEDGGRKTEDGGRKTEDGGRKTEDGGRKTEDGGRKTEDGGRKTEDGGRKTEDGRQKTEKFQISNFKSQISNNFVIAGSGSGYLNSKKFIQFIEDVESGKKEEKRTGFLLIVFILLGGLALNLTPCVLPMIPINIAIIGAGAQASSRKRGLALGGAYGLGIAITYGVLGLVVVLTGSKFGAINSSALFNFAIAILFVFLALAMFDILQIDFTKYQTKLSGSGIKKGSFFAAYFIGSVAALLAGACVAPVVIYVLVLSANIYSGGNIAALFLPFLLGLGMGFPWPFVGAGLSFLPKPGAWMVRVKYVFGIFIIVFATYYAWIGYGILKPVKAVENHSSGWETSLSIAFEKARKENKPVFIDFWATWCKNCTTMNKTTFKNPEVIQKLEKYIKVKYQAEKPDKFPAKEVLDYFGVKGLPTYVIGRVDGKQ